MIRALLFLALATLAHATTYYVRKDGNNSNSGLANTAGGAWLTIAFAESQIAAGDIVRVQTGAYEERPNITPGGSAGNYKTFIADGAVLMRGFDISNSSYIKIIGFEIAHTTNSQLNGITFSTGTCTYVEIVDNYIHNTSRNGIGADQETLTSYITIRGNTIAFSGYIPGVEDEDPWAAVTANYYQPGGMRGLASDHWLVEYNTLPDNIDVLHIFGAYNVMRNNYIPRHRANVGEAHPDVFQSSSDGVGNFTGTAHHVVEANFASHMPDGDSHFGIWQDTAGAGDTDILIRGNIAWDFGSGAIGVIATTYVNAYNNTCYKTSQAQTDPGNVNVMIWRYYSDTMGQSDYATCINNIIDNYGTVGGIALTIETPETGGLKSTNVGHDAGTDTSYISTASPQFTAPDSGDFTIASGSPARNAGMAHTTITSMTGSGTSFTVARPDRLRDGYGITDGDTVTVGATTTTITGISGSTVTVAASVSWTQNDPIYWGSDTTPDIGALPFGSSKLVSATLSQVGNDYTVTTAGSCRGVWFYVNGIPTTWDSTAPYTATIASGTVTARAYALYAQTGPVVPDRWNTQSAGMSGRASLSGRASIK